MIETIVSVWLRGPLVLNGPVRRPTYFGPVRGLSFSVRSLIRIKKIQIKKIRATDLTKNLINLFKSSM